VEYYSSTSQSSHQLFPRRLLRSAKASSFVTSSSCGSHHHRRGQELVIEHQMVLAQHPYRTCTYKQRNLSQTYLGVYFPPLQIRIQSYLAIFPSQTRLVRKSIQRTLLTVRMCVYRKRDSASTQNYRVALRLVRTKRRIYIFPKEGGRTCLGTAVR